MNPRLLATAALVIASISGCAITSVTVSPSNTGPSISHEDAGKRRAPDAIGTDQSVSIVGDYTSVVFTPDAGYEYFDATTFDFTSEDGSNGIDGVTLDPRGLAVGDQIRVWTSVCAESFPVQCQTEYVDRIEP